ncbi:MAG: bifunctional pyr operon transcriptional regulator/uracil phosphoribosyltransferase PyrR [Fimbriimonadaceae bacterium]|nr:bifunctional pyr operon transcriptional regulator/uracil phosphoribosyltransferase PyrR [Fimbriimonadaceae bacterium]
MSVVLMDAAAMRRTLGRMAHEILEANDGGEDLVVVGVLNGGVPVAKKLAFMMTQVEGYTIPSGRLDIRKFRDDKPAVDDDASEIPFQVNGRTVILVDDVIFTGRSIRAAMDAIMQFGRPSSVQLAVLVDRGHRELPIQPDYCGATLHTERGDHIKVMSHEEGGEDGILLEPGDDE